MQRERQAAWEGVRQAYDGSYFGTIIQDLVHAYLGWFGEVWPNAAKEDRATYCREWSKALRKVATGITAGEKDAMTEDSEFLLAYEEAARKEAQDAEVERLALIQDGLPSPFDGWSCECTDGPCSLFPCKSYQPEGAAG